MKKILWIDDEPYYLEAYIDYLRSAGWDVNIVPEINRAIKVLQDKTILIDLIITDIMHPPDQLLNTGHGLNTGFVLFNEIISKHRQNLPCIFLSNRRTRELSSYINRNTDVYFFSKTDLLPSELLKTISFIYDQKKESLFTLPPISSKQNEIIRIDFNDVNVELISYLQRHPNLLYELNPHTFEDLIASLLKNQGYFIHQTKKTRDGGKDMYAISKTALGNLMFLVECKKYNEKNLVGVELIRSLYGVVEAEGVNAGIMVTTSYYSKPAIQFQQSIGSRISLIDYNILKEWLDRYK